MSDPSPAPLNTWLIEPMPAEVLAAVERLRRAEDVQRIAIMPDVHLAKDVCVGTVLATRRVLYPGAVGGDIGCGMLALAFDAGAEAMADAARAAKVLLEIQKVVPASRRHRQRVVPYPSDVEPSALSHPSLQASARKEGALQLGTLGGGNHFVELQADEDERLWLMVHSGSRAMGQLIRAHHCARARVVAGKLLALGLDSADGQAYFADMSWARRYADANRRAIAEAVVESVRRQLGIRPVAGSLITCDHNHVAIETHGEQLLVHRKGAMPAADGLAGVMPGSMGTRSYHVEGRGCAESLCSSAHGAGRALSRESARKRVSIRALCRQMEGVWFDYRRAAELREEAPAAYKDIQAVLRAQHDLVRIVRTLRPVLAYKSG